MDNKECGVLTYMIFESTDKAQDGRAEEAEKAKQDQLQDQKEGKGHWVDELASDSESAVCAALPATLSLSFPLD